MKNLVIIPAGKTSEHQKWTQDHKDYGFDLCLLNYSHPHVFQDKNSKEAKFVINESGMKFKLMTKFIESHSSVMDEYDYTLLMDDDVVTTPVEIQKFFSVCSNDNFDLAQPALCSDSTYTFMPTLRINNARYHLTNMVEIMMPCFSKRLFKETFDDIRHSKYGHGWGLEGIWNKKFHVGNGLTKFGGKIGVIDCVDFCHLRPLGGGDTKIYEKFGSPREELHDQETRVGFKWADMNFSTYSIVWDEEK
jgi:hypothetical protein